MKINLNNKHLLTFLLLFVGFMLYLNISAIQHFFYVNEIPGDIKHVIRTSSLVDLTTSFENSDDVYEYYIQHYARIDQYLEQLHWEEMLQKYWSIGWSLIGCWILYNPTFTKDDYIEIFLGCLRLLDKIYRDHPLWPM